MRHLLQTFGKHYLLSFLITWSNLPAFSQITKEFCCLLFSKVNEYYLYLLKWKIN
jgi:hypothetical protein